MSFENFVGIFYTLPNTEKMLNREYTHVYVTYTNSAKPIDLSLLKRTSDTDLVDPLETYGRQENDKRVVAGQLEATTEVKTAHFECNYDEYVINGIQLFGWDVTTTLNIKSIVFSEKELTQEEVDYVTANGKLPA